MADLAALRGDLAAEQEALDGLVAYADDAAWLTPTPAEGWDVRDQISHLAFFEEQAALAAGDPDGFRASLAGIAADPAAFVERPIDRGRALSPGEVLSWWRTERAGALDAFGRLDPGRRVPWFGPAMSPASFVTARIMETWAHGQDVEDALGITREPTDRLAHVAYIGFRARPYSFEVRGLELPQAPVRVELTLPSGAIWTAGDAGGDVVSGLARDFCLVVVQRRHIADTDLEVVGEGARRWMEIAQAFAGPPGPGRAPGQFPGVAS